MGNKKSERMFHITVFFATLYVLSSIGNWVNSENKAENTDVQKIAEKCLIADTQEASKMRIGIVEYVYDEVVLGCTVHKILVSVSGEQIELTVRYPIYAAGDKVELIECVFGTYDLREY